MTDNARGALIMMAAMAAFTLNDMFVKLVLRDLPMFQALFLRSVTSVLAFLPLLHLMKGLRALPGRRDRALIALRTLAEIGATVFFVLALLHMPLANISAVLQALPLTVTLAAAVFLGEKVGWKRLTAILLGFVGVLLIVRPGAEGFDRYALLALVSVGCVTLRDLATRRLSAAVPGVLVAFSAAVGLCVFSGIAAAQGEWVRPGAANTVWLVTAACFTVTGYMMSVAAMRCGDLGVVAPFRYTGLLWALVLGFAVFGEWPDGLTLLGAAIVVATGVFTLYRERRAAARD